MFNLTHCLPLTLRYYYYINHSLSQIIGSNISQELKCFMITLIILFMYVLLPLIKVVSNLDLTDFLLCCCLPTPMTLASGGSPMFPLVVHKPASPSIWPAV